MLEQIEKAFAQELLSVSHKATGLLDFAWAVCNIGGAIPISAVQTQFKNAEEYVSILSKAGVMRYAMGGFINRDQKKQSLSISLSESLLDLHSKGVRRKEFETIIFREYGDKLISHCRSELTEPLAVMLTSIIFYATPDKPAFSNSVVRKASNVSMKTHMECQNILDYYLHRFLGLVTFETGSLLNLSVRSQQRVRNYPKLWETYVRPYQDKEKPKEEEIKMPEPVVQAREHTTKASEQEKRIKAYFPWLKL